MLFPSESAPQAGTPAIRNVLPIDPGEDERSVPLVPKLDQVQ